MQETGSQIVCSDTHLPPLRAWLFVGAFAFSGCQPSVCSTSTCDCVVNASHSFTEFAMAGWQLNNPLLDFLF
jgi:hypothetical protein